MVALDLLGTLLMGLAVVAAFVVVSRVGLRREPPSGPGEAGTSTYDAAVDRLGDVAGNPAVWTLSFVVVAVGLSLAALAAVGDLGLPEAVTGPLFGVVVGIVGLLIGGFVFFGTYTAVRARGLGNAHGVMGGSLVLGLVLVFAIAVQLVFKLV